MVQGRRLMRLWFLRPVVNLAVVNDRQDTVELLVNAPHDATALRGILKKVRLCCASLPCP